jgi:hypothetical protein
MLEAGGVSRGKVCKCGHKPIAPASAKLTDVTVCYTTFYRGGPGSAGALASLATEDSWLQGTSRASLRPSGVFPMATSATAASSRPPSSPAIGVFRVSRPGVAGEHLALCARPCPAGTDPLWYRPCVVQTLPRWNGPSPFGTPPFGPGLHPFAAGSAATERLRPRPQATPHSPGAARLRPLTGVLPLRKAWEPHPARSSRRRPLRSPWRLPCHGFILERHPPAILECYRLRVVRGIP